MFWDRRDVRADGPDEDDEDCREARALGLDAVEGHVLGLGSAREGPGEHPVVAQEGRHEEARGHV
eukprot:7974742-Alexandrium_andersonii.AAC.1